MANHLNRPSIFEIATAFNNGTPPQHDGYEKHTTLSQNF